MKGRRTTFVQEVILYPALAGRQTDLKVPGILFDQLRPSLHNPSE